MIGISLGLVLFVVHWVMVAVERRNRNVWKLKVISTKVSGAFKVKTLYFKDRFGLVDASMRYDWCGPKMEVSKLGFVSGKWAVKAVW